MKETTMHQTLKLASWLLATALFSMPFTSFAQTTDADEDTSDTDVAVNVGGEVVEHAVGLPTSLRSAVTMGLEKATGAPFSIDSAIEVGAKAAGVADAAAAVLSNAIGGVLSVTFDSSSIATDDEEGSPYQMQQQAQQAQDAQALADQYSQNLINEIQQPIWKNLPSPAQVQQSRGPQIINGGQRPAGVSQCSGERCF